MASTLAVLSSEKSSSISPCCGFLEQSKSSVTYPRRGGGLGSKAQFAGLGPSGRLCMGGSEGREFSCLWKECSHGLISQLLVEFLPLTFVLGKSCKPHNPTQTEHILFCLFHLDLWLSFCEGMTNALHHVLKEWAFWKSMK